jgi:psp operon transcriptional activator
MRDPESIIGNSPALTQAMEHLSQLAPVNRPVLILGERGTGKELAAQRLHFLSARWEQPLLKVNCAAIAESLLESELFGHEKGAFTGATNTHIGRFERADSGTLFLDELGTTSSRLQEKLLRLVEYGEFERVGGQETLQVDVRVIGATNADLPAAAERGEFRADLLDRLSFDVVHLPPLRHRAGDVLDLAEYFAIQMSAELGWDLFPGFGEVAQEQLLAHTWPGNVRELTTAVVRSLYRWADGSIAVNTIVVDPFTPPYQDTPATAPEAKAKAADNAEEDFATRMRELERSLLADALAANGHNQRRTAETLGLSYDQIRGMVRKHGLSRRRQAS